MVRVNTTDRVPSLITTAVLPLEESQQIDLIVETPSTSSFFASLEDSISKVTGNFSNLTSPLMPVGGADPEGNPESASISIVKKAAISPRTSKWAET